jgi:hypothetical protein
MSLRLLSLPPFSGHLPMVLENVCLQLSEFQLHVVEAPDHQLTRLAFAAKNRLRRRGRRFGSDRGKNPRQLADR